MNIIQINLIFLC